MDVEVDINRCGPYVEVNFVNIPIWLVIFEILYFLLDLPSQDQVLLHDCFKVYDLIFFDKLVRFCKNDFFTAPQTAVGKDVYVISFKILIKIGFYSFEVA